MTSSAETRVIASRYRLDERVGAGSMGAVWRATDELLGRTVAVKQLLLQPGAPGFDPGDYDDARERMLREGRLAARLQHANTIGVFDAVVHDDVPWLVMEYLECRTLGELAIEEGPLDPQRVAEIGRQVAAGLAAAHAAGIVHRDIKPSNVLIGRDGSVKITDFGVSRAADDVQLTRTGMIAGTPAYLAPEVARGQTPTQASDVFALGSTLYACVEGSPPFGLDDNAYAMLYNVGVGEVQEPTRAGPLAPTLMRMLNKEPGHRPSAAQARDELAAVADGRQPGDPPPTVRTAAPVQRTSMLPPIPPPVVPPVRPAVEPEPPLLAPFRDGDGATRVDLTAPMAASSTDRAPVDRAPIAGSPRDGSPGPAAGAWQPQPDTAGNGGAAPPARPMRPSGPDGSGRPRRRVWLVAAALLLLALVGGITLSRQTAGTEVPPSPSLAEPTTTADVPPVPAAPSPRAESPSAESSAPSTERRGADGEQPSREDLQRFVREYYALLPDDTEKAWDMLGPQARRQSINEQTFRTFYNGVSDVSFVDGPIAVDDRTVRASLVFQMKDGRRLGPDPYQFVVEPGPNGELIMTSFVN